MPQDTLIKKKDRQEKYMESALFNLAAVSDKKRPGVEAISDNPLVNSCMYVAEKMKMKINIPSKEKLEKSNDLLDEIAKASRIRYRQVALRGDWWKRDNGPLLAFFEEDNRPIALIPQSLNTYKLFDTTNKKEMFVDADTAKLIKPFAYVFYRPFPSEPIGLKQLFSLSLEMTAIRDIIIILLMGLAGGLLGMINPLVTGIIIDNIVPQADRSQLLIIGFLLLSFAIGKVFFQLTRSTAMVRMEGKMDSFGQSAVWDRLISLPMTFFRDFNSGELAMRAMGISQIRQVLSGATISTIISSVFSLFNGLLMFNYSVKLSLVAMALILFAVAVSLILGYYQVQLERKKEDMENKISGFMLQIIEGVTKFRVSGSEHRAFYQWSKQFAVLRKICFSKELFANILNTFNAIFPLIAYMTLFYMLGGSKGEMTTGEFVAFNASLGIFMVAMLQISDTILEVNTIIPTYENIKPILCTLPEYNEEKEDPGEIDGKIEIGHITFSYEKNGPVILDDISLKIKKGEYVAIVGASGCGKSTLLRILLGFEKAESGKVYYSGKDLETVDIRALRKQFGVVLQNGQLIAGDIFSNIVGTNPALTIKDAEEAAQMAGLLDDIKDMPMGFNTIVSEGGSTLSGGQRQRLMIARAIVNKPKILFFDEATSALDNNTQKHVSDSLDKLDATRIVIAHRLSTVMNCDRIIVLEKGKIAEEGNYKELMAKDGIFAQLAKRQLA